MTRAVTIRAVAALALVATATAGPVGTPAASGATPPREYTHMLIDDGRGTSWVVDKRDNICGLDEPRQLSRPAKVDYQKLLSATPEVKQIKRKRIDPNSAEGVRLMSKARSRILSACEKVRSAKGHCSVWKKISLRDPKKDKKKKPVDVTSSVKGEIDKSKD